MHEYRLETERLILRPFCEEDAEAAFVWQSDPDVNRFMSYALYKTPDQTRDWIRGLDDEEDSYEFGFERKSDGLLIGAGSVGLCREGVWELGYNLRRDCWNQGYATEAARAILRFACQTLGAREFTANHAVDNPASGRVMEHCGMRFDHFGEYAKSDGSAKFRAKYYRLTVEESDARFE